MTSTTSTVGGAAKPARFRVPCPRGHVLKAGPHLFGRQVVCPECNEMFVLRQEDSVEHRREQEKARLAVEERNARRWLSWSIWAAVFIVASLAAMIAVSFAARQSASPPDDPPSEPAPAVQTE